MGPESANPGGIEGPESGSEPICLLGLCYITSSYLCPPALNGAAIVPSLFFSFFFFFDKHDSSVILVGFQEREEANVLGSAIFN